MNTLIAPVAAGAFAMQPISAADCFFQWWTETLGRQADYSAEYEAARDAWLTATAIAQDRRYPKDRLEDGIEYALSGDGTYILSHEDFAVHVAVTQNRLGAGVGISVWHPEDDPRDPMHSHYVVVDRETK